MSLCVAAEGLSLLLPQLPAPLLLSKLSPPLPLLHPCDLLWTQLDCVLGAGLLARLPPPSLRCVPSTAPGTRGWRRGPAKTRNSSRIPPLFSKHPSTPQEPHGICLYSHLRDPFPSAGSSSYLPFLKLLLLVWLHFLPPWPLSCSSLSVVPPPGPLLLQGPSPPRAPPILGPLPPLLKTTAFPCTPSPL